MRILVNHSSEDAIYRPALQFLLKEQGLSGVATSKVYDITTIRATAKQASCDAILLTNQDTLKNLVGDSATLDAYRGSRINYDTPIIVANPLEHIHTVNEGKWLLQQDLKKFKRIKEAVQEFDFLVADTQEVQVQALAFLRKCVVISFDIETDEAPQITCISFTGLHEDGRVFSFILPLVDFAVVHYKTPEELGHAIRFMQNVLNLEVPKLAWNGIYDTQYCILYHAFPNYYLLDAMILAWSKYAELPRALEFWASLTCYDYFYWKNESDAAKKGKDLRGYWAYCCKDSWYTLRILLELLANLEQYQIFNYKETFKLTFPHLYCAFEGFHVNVEKRAELKLKAEQKRDEKLSDLRKITANETFNPGSWQQVAPFIYEVIGAKRITIKGSKKKSTAGTDSKTLNRVAMQHPLLARICDLIISYREEVKAIGTYYEFPLLNNRLLYNIDPSGTETMRASSKASNFWVGTQIQNIPPYAKPMLEADPGFELIEPDKNKSEARCVAYMSGDENLIKDLEDLSKDFYKVVTERFFGIPYDQVTKEMRNDVTKHIIHGTHHVMGPQPFIDTATPKRIYQAMGMLKWKGNMEEFVKFLLSLYHKGYTKVRTFWKEEVMDKLLATNKTVSPLGWTRYFFGNPMKNHAVFRGAVAHQSQNLSVHIINREYWQIYKRLVTGREEGVVVGEFRLKAQIHDSILAQAKKERREYYQKRMLEIMTSEKVVVKGRIMLLPTDVKVGENWGAFHEKENPKGMVELK